MSEKILHAPLLPLAFRDTALTVAMLADDAIPVTFGELRAKCAAQVDMLRREWASAGHSPDVIRDASYAQCALLDEAALVRLKDGDRDAWEKEPLQVKEFHTNDAGDELIALIQRRLAEPRPKLALLSIFSAALGLGFKGKFAFNGADARHELMRALDERIGQIAARDTSGTVWLNQDGARARHLSWSPLACVAAGVVVAALVYLGLWQWLASSVARIAA